MFVYEVDSDVSIVSRFKLHEGLLRELELFATLNDVIKFDQVGETLVGKLSDSLCIAVRYPTSSKVLTKWIAEQRERAKRRL